MLQTLRVKLKTQKKEQQVSILIDTGSQHSYILKRTAEELGLKSIENIVLIDSLFEGIITEERLHCVYDVKLISFEGDFSFDINVLDQKIICGDICRLRKRLLQ